MIPTFKQSLAAACVLLPLHAMAQTTANMTALKGLAPITTLPSTAQGRAALAVARTDLVAALEAGCGDKVEICAREDIGRLSDPAANAAFYAATQTYSLPFVHPEMVGKVEDVAQVAPEAGYLLTAAFPYLSLEQANRILTETEGPGGGFLNDGSAFGLYSRLNLHAAGGRAAASVPK